MNPPSSHTPSNLYETGGNPIENCKRQFRAQLTLIKRKKDAQVVAAAARGDNGDGDADASGKNASSPTPPPREPDWAAIAVAEAAQKFGV